MTDQSHEYPSLQYLTKMGEEFYLSELREKLEQTDYGNYVVIEPESKEYFIDEDLLVALQAAEQVFPDKYFTIIKIGSLKPPMNNYKRNHTQYARAI